MEITNRIYYIKKLDYHNKKKVTWDNEELYLNCLYNFWIESLSNIIVYYSDESIAPSEILKSQQYLEIVNKIKEEKDENKKEILIKMKSTLILLNGQFIDYLTALRYFLKTTEKNFDKRFKKIELKTMDDHLLFEDYMQFLSTYRFEEFSLDLVHLWNETFVPLNIKEKKIILANFGIGNIELNENGSEIRTKKNEIFGQKTLNIDILALQAFVNYCNGNVFAVKKKFINNKFIKPCFYREHLFVNQTKKYWKELLIQIFRSNVYKEIRNSLFTQEQIDFFESDSILSDIIDNIKFYIYNTPFIGATNKVLSTIYEYGCYDISINNESLALLIFYGFHIIINLHEIGGHLNIKLQYYITLDDNFDSPKIRDNEKDLYSSSALDRNKESGETVEIELFGEVKTSLSIREALYILDRKNYEGGLKEFKEGYRTCNNKKISELLNEPLKKLLKNLNIDVNYLDEKDKNSYPYPLKRKSYEGNKEYYITKPRHPRSFYYDIPDLTKIIIDSSLLYSTNKGENL